jgi:hypothetical protein
MILIKQNHTRGITAASIVILVVAFGGGSLRCNAQDLPYKNPSAALDDKYDPTGIVRLLETRYTPDELEAPHDGQMQIEPVLCGCYDKPKKHYPYTFVLLKTPKADWLVRADGNEAMVQFVGFAVRQGEQYCDLDDKSRCFGDFAHPCDFTDYRFGAKLRRFFPTCLSEDR